MNRAGGSQLRTTRGPGPLSFSTRQVRLPGGLVNPEGRGGEGRGGEGRGGEGREGSNRSTFNILHIS